MAYQKKVRLCIDFASKMQAIEWFNDLKEGGKLGGTAAAYQLTPKDNRKDTGVTAKNTFIVDEEGTRNEGTRLKERVVVDEKQVVA